MRFATLIKLCIASSTLLASPVLFAGFSTYSTNWPDNADSVDERISKPEASEKPTDVVAYTDDTDKDAYVANERVSEFKRLYAKIGLTLLTAEARQVQNTSNSSLASASVVNNTAKQDYASWEFGLGTRLQYVRLELEYLYQKQLPYNATPLFATSSTSINSELTTQALWFDVFYDMEKLNLPYFTPYLGGMVGVIWNETRTTIYGSPLEPNAAKNHSRICLGWGVTFGIRMPFWTRWYGFVGYKYLAQGMARWQSYNGNVDLKAYPVTQGFDLGVTYLLG